MLSSRDIKARMDRRHKFIVSDKHKFIYYEIQKCATETMRRYFLGQKNRMVTNNPYGARRISGGRSKAYPYEQDCYMQFTFVRNPWARTISAWLSKFKYYYDPKHPTLPGIRDPQLSLNTTFEEYVDFILKVPDDRADCHFKSMHCFIPEKNITVGRVESLESDFNGIRLQLGLPLLPVPRENVTNKTAPWQDYYTDILKDKVAQRYAKDIELYGYSFD